MVSYLWSVVSLAALKLPLRITTNRVYAISATQAIHRRAHGNERTQFWQTQRGRPPLMGGPTARAGELIHWDHLRRNLAPIMLPSTTQGGDYPLSAV